MNGKDLKVKVEGHMASADALTKEHEDRGANKSWEFLSDETRMKWYKRALSFAAKAGTMGIKITDGRI
jgi:hypothetical protein